LKAIEPTFVDYDFNTVGTERIALALTYSDARQAVPSVRLSSGTLTYLGLIVLISTPNRPPVLMIEEPENGLTPQAVRSFYEAARSLAYHEVPDQRSQVLISSHSPFVRSVEWRRPRFHSSSQSV
jgi:predicted ATPase